MRYNELLDDQYIEKIKQSRYCYEIDEPEYLIIDQDLDDFVSMVCETWDYAHLKSLSAKIYNGEIEKLDAGETGIQIELLFARKKNQDNLEIMSDIKHGPLVFKGYAGVTHVRKLFKDVESAKHFILWMQNNIAQGHTVTIIDPNKIL